MPRQWLIEIDGTRYVVPGDNPPQSETEARALLKAQNIEPPKAGAVPPPESHTTTAASAPPATSGWQQMAANVKGELNGDPEALKRDLAATGRTAMGMVEAPVSAVKGLVSPIITGARTLVNTGDPAKAVLDAGNQVAQGLAGTVKGVAQGDPETLGNVLGGALLPNYFGAAGKGRLLNKVGTALKEEPSGGGFGMASGGAAGILGGLLGIPVGHAVGIPSTFADMALGRMLLAKPIRAAGRGLENITGGAPEGPTLRSVAADTAKTATGAGPQLRPFQSGPPRGPLPAQEIPGSGPVKATGLTPQDIVNLQKAGYPQDFIDRVVQQEGRQGLIWNPASPTAVELRRLYGGKRTGRPTTGRLPLVAEGEQLDAAYRDALRNEKK